MLNSLLSEIQHLTLSSCPDTWKLSIGLDDLFSVGSTRVFIDEQLLPSLNLATRWNTCLPRKVNIFIWRMRLDRLPHRLNLSKRGLELSFARFAIIVSNQSIMFSSPVKSPQMLGD